MNLSNFGKINESIYVIKFDAQYRESYSLLNTNDGTVPDSDHA
jgi:hypothetical protein